MPNQKFLTPDIIKKRIPFVNKFTFFDRENEIKGQYNKIDHNVTIPFGEKIFTVNAIYKFLEFRSYKYNIGDTFFHIFYFDTLTVLHKPAEMNDLDYRILILLLRQSDKQDSFIVEIRDKNEILSEEQLNKFFNDVNKHFFEIESRFEQNQRIGVNPLSEDIQIPQNYDSEFNQTGSGKSINMHKGKSVETILTNIKNKIKEAKEVSTEYKKYFNSNTKDFKVRWNNRIEDCSIPQQFSNTIGLNGEPVNYKYYFDYPDLGDGAFQVAVYQSGFIQAKHITYDPNRVNGLPNHSVNDFNGTAKYFTVKSGVLGKTEKKYSIFKTPAVDAVIKCLINFEAEILAFLENKPQVDDNAEQADKQALIVKLDKIRKDAEDQIGKPISSSEIWQKFKTDKFNTFIENPSGLKTLDATKELISLFNPVKKSEISIDDKEIQDFNQRQADIKARLDAYRNRKK